jgi:hypothetical protein
MPFDTRAVEFGAQHRDGLAQPVSAQVAVGAKTS